MASVCGRVLWRKFPPSSHVGVKLVAQKRQHEAIINERKIAGRSQAADTVMKGGRLPNDIP
jgi:hypothetical protein